MVENRVPAQLLRPSAQRGVLRPSTRGPRRQAAHSRGTEALVRRALLIADTLLLWLERARQRRSLGSLSDHMLKDLGLSRCDAGRETGKRFWEG
jgi:uncharacterized protein YjiS (DUF1127 family)